MIAQDVAIPKRCWETALPGTTTTHCPSSEAIVHCFRGTSVDPMNSAIQHDPSMEKSERVGNKHGNTTERALGISQDWHLYEARLAQLCGTGTNYAAR